MADEPKPEDPDTANEPGPVDEPDPRVDERGKAADEEAPADVIDDDRFQATDN
jgi:hypothetical protein